MAFGTGNGGRSGWSSVVIALIGLLVVAMVVSIVLQVVKVLIFTALFVAAAMLVLRAVRGPR